MAAIRHLGFVKFKLLLTVIEVKRPILHQRAKFRRDRSNRYGDIAIFVIFQDGGRRHLGYSKIQNFNGLSAARGQHSWWRGTVVERRSLAGELSLSCARPAADG